MKAFERIKKFIGADRHSPYIKNYFDKSNIRSAVYVTSVIIALEVFMIINISARQFFEETRRTREWFIIHLSCYSILLLASLSLFIYSIRHIKKPVKNRTLFEILKYIFPLWPWPLVSTFPFWIIPRENSSSPWWPWRFSYSALSSGGLFIPSSSFRFLTESSFYSATVICLRHSPQR